jgi:hypothetical protein
MFEAIFDKVLIAGVPLIVMVLGLVEFSKQLGVKGKGLMVLAMVVGTLFYGTHKAAEMYPVIAPWLELVVYGLGGGVAATGIYDLINKRLPEKTLAAYQGGKLTAAEQWLPEQTEP